jgi:hypothetical protein
MFRFNRLVCALLVCSCVGFAYAKAIKVVALTPVGAGVTESPDADGMALLNYNPGQTRTEVQVSLTDFQANTEYTVDVLTVYGGPTLRMITNARGNAQGHAIAITDITDGGNATAEVTVYIDSNDDYFPTEEEKRAVGSN